MTMPWLRNITITSERGAAHIEVLLAEAEESLARFRPFLEGSPETEEATKPMLQNIQQFRDALATWRATHPRPAAADDQPKGSTP